MERGKVGGRHKKFSGERRAKGRVRLLRARGTAELRGSLWLCYAASLAEKRKSGISGGGVDRSRFPGRRTVRKIRRGGRQASDRAEKRVYSFLV